MIKKYTCQNGVRIVLEEIPTVRSVAIGIWVKTGSRYETREQNGISHFLEHMFLKEQKIVRHKRLLSPLIGSADKLMRSLQKNILVITPKY